MAVTEQLENYTSGIFVDTTGAMDIEHVVSVYGWGVENNTKYWLIRNSWGTYWGEKGFFKLIKGVNNMNIESHCAWVVPRDTWTKDERNTTV